MEASAILIVVWMLCRAIGAAGFPLFASWKSAFPYAFAVMLIFTAIAHFKRREELQAMVPRWIIDPDLVVLITGLLELAGAAGLLFRFTRPLAVTGLVVLLIAIFPANIKASLHPWVAYFSISDAGIDGSNLCNNSRAPARSLISRSNCAVCTASKISPNRGPGFSPRAIKSRPVSKGGGMIGSFSNSFCLLTNRL